MYMHTAALRESTFKSSGIGYSRMRAGAPRLLRILAMYVSAGARAGFARSGAADGRPAAAAALGLVCPASAWWRLSNRKILKSLILVPE